MVRASAPGSGKPGSFPFGAITSRSDSVGAAGALCSGRAVSGSGGGRGGSMGGVAIWAPSRPPASDLTASLLATWTRVGRGLRATLWRPLRRPSRIAPLVMMRVELPQWRAVTPRLATSGPASSAAGPFPPCGPKPRSARASSRVFDPRADQDLQRLRLLQRIDRVVADPHKLEPGLVHALPDHMVERVLDPRLERHKPFLRRLLAQGLARRPVDLRYEGRNGDREGVEDDAGQPFVVLVLQRRLAGLDQLEVGGHELRLAPARQVATHQRVEIVLERADLVGGPFLRQGGEGVGRGARAVIVERRGVAPQRDVDGESDLFDRAHAIHPMGAEVARQVEELYGGEVGGGGALEDLLVGGIGRAGRAPR